MSKRSLTESQQVVRHAIRAAVLIREHLAGPARIRQFDGLPVALWEELSRAVQRAKYVQGRGWNTAMESVLLDVDLAASRLTSALDSFRRQLPADRRRRGVATCGEIAGDLLSLNQEFDDFALDLDEKTIAVTTDTIILEGLDLGPFRIVLDWSRIGNARPYDVIAEDPNCAGDQSDVTHPHVRDQVLCEGEGAAAIRAALASGRLLDFFLLVRQVLQTYNAGSAHVAINAWSGVSCTDCGTSLLSDDHSSCCRCNDPLCDDCGTCCHGCDDVLCNECASTCGECDRTHCNACLTDWGNRRLCPSCYRKETSDDQDDRLPAEADGLCLGEAARAA